MNSLTTQDFERVFAHLTDNPPFPWQTEMYRQFEQGIFQREELLQCDIPTGLGKTSIIAIWRIALANGLPVPRRLAYVVNRRTVVDQTTWEVERLQEKLKTLKGGPFPLEVSTLRGQFADNRQWSADPSVPAVICGTVDMIGSRLLFGGYRIGFKSRPLHAGFLGQDTLLVHDESHLEPAFQHLIETIQAEQRRERTIDLPWPKLRVMSLSATNRGQEDKDKPTIKLGLTDEEANPPEDIPEPAKDEPPIHKVWRRLRAKKTLRLHEIEKDKPTDLVAKLALNHQDSDQSILVYLRTVKDAYEVAEKISKGLKQAKLPDTVPVLTGTIRGHEREQLIPRKDKEEPSATAKVFARFMPAGDRPKNCAMSEGTAYLVCTSAGEVGVNLSADHMVCDLSTFESMAQRLGRVNRFGDSQSTQVDVVHPATFDEKNSLDPPRKRTLDLLKSMGEDASPLALGRFDAKARNEAFSPILSIPTPSDIIFDAWALTTIRDKMPGRPTLAPYLHGITDWDPPRASVGWRNEVDWVNREILSRHGANFAQVLLEDFPLKPHELLTDNCDRIYAEFQAMAQRVKRIAKQDEEAAKDFLVWIVDPQGEVRTDQTVKKLAEMEKKDFGEAFNNATFLLPPNAGGLADGRLSGKAEFSVDEATIYDASCQSPGDATQLYRFRTRTEKRLPTQRVGLTWSRTLDLDPEADERSSDGEHKEAETEDAGGTSDPLKTSDKGRFWHWYTLATETEDVTRIAGHPVPLDMHVGAVERYTREIVARLNLPKELQQSLILAAQLHDLGKRREIWQRGIGNPTPSEPYAKPGKFPGEPRWRPRRLSDYRHEFGSILDVIQESAELKPLSCEMQDVVLHVIATHHGYGRPHFLPGGILDPDHDEGDSRRASLNAMRRYARLQRRYGRWGLAYLESILRAADWAASAESAEETSVATEACEVGS